MEQRNNDPRAYAYVQEKASPADVFNHMVQPGQMPKYEPTQRRPVDVTDIQLFNTVLNGLAASGIVGVTEEGQTEYESVVDDKSRRLGNEFLQQMITRFSEEVKIRENNG